MSNLLLPPSPAHDAASDLTTRPLAADCDMISNPNAPGEPVVVAGRREPSGFARFGLTQRDVVLLFTSLLLTSVYLPIFSSWYWTPRMMVVIVAAAVGAVALADLARRGDRAAWFASAALAWSVVSAVASDETLLVIKGHHLHESTVLTTVGAFGLWALARGMSSTGHRWLVSFFVAAVALNTAVAAVQVLAGLETGDLGLAGGRATGLTPNAGHLGAYTAAGAIVGIHQLVRSASVRAMVGWGIGTAAFGAGLAFSGSRVGVGAVVLVAGWMIITRRGVRSVAGFAIASVGVVIGSLIARSAGSNDSLSRSGTLRSGGRGERWTTGWSAFTERPLTGWGFGRFRTATQGRWSFDFVSMTEDGQRIMDAHNIVVALLVAVGLPGLLLFVAFTIQCMRRARGPLALAAAAISITWLLQPAGLSTLPLCVMLLGASMVQAPASLDDEAARHTPDDPAEHTVSTHRRGVNAAFAVAAVLGVSAAAFFAAADLRLADARSTMGTEELDAAAAWFVDDPLVERLVAQGWSARASVDPEFLPGAIERAEITVESEPLRPYWWTQLAGLQGRAGDIEGARASAERALELQPTSLSAWNILSVVAAALDDDVLADEAMTNLCRLGADECTR